MSDLFNKYFHFTCYNNMNNISQLGLIPQNGFRCNAINDDRVGVFLSKGIDRALVMYAAMYYQYKMICEYNVSEQINIIQKEINRWENRKNYVKDIEFINERIAKLQLDIEKIKSIMQCKQFSDYLGGEGCLLSINKLNNYNSVNLEDCCYNNIIPSNNINMVFLYDKYINKYISSRELIMTYLMNYFSTSDLLRKLSNDYKDCIDILYKDKFEYLNIDNYVLQDIPIKSYDYINQKISPITFI